MLNDISHQEIILKLEAQSQLLQRIHNELTLHKQLIENAFVLDDRGQPDYGNHKRHHIEIDQTEKRMNEYKKAVTLRLLQGGVGIFLTILGLGIGQYVIKTFKDLSVF